MLMVFIIFGIIVLISFITGVILMYYENKNKNKNNEELTDNPRILFSVDEEKAVIVKNNDDNSLLEQNLTNNKVSENNSEKVTFGSENLAVDVKLQKDIQVQNILIDSRTISNLETSIDSNISLATSSFSSNKEVLDDSSSYEHGSILGGNSNSEVDKKKELVVANNTNNNLFSEESEEII